MEDTIDLKLIVKKFVLVIGTIFSLSVLFVCLLRFYIIDIQDLFIMFLQQLKLEMIITLNLE